MNKPFDLEAARRGEKFGRIGLTLRVAPRFVGSMLSGDIAYEVNGMLFLCKTSDLEMLPKKVYKTKLKSAAVYPGEISGLGFSQRYFGDLVSAEKYAKKAGGASIMEVDEDDL